MSDVWCNQCDQPAVVTITLTTREKVAKCDRHAWLLRAPRGGKR